MAYYTPGTPATKNTLARAENIATELTTIVAAFDKIPEQLSLEQDRQAYALDTGAANAYVVAMPNTWTAYTTGAALRVKIVNANTGDSTINVDGLGVISIKHHDGTALDAGDLPADSIKEMFYDGTNFQVSTGTVQISNAVIGPASATDNAVVRFDATTGKLVQNSDDTLDDSNVYTHAGATIWKKGADIASATPLVIDGAGNFRDVTGTTAWTTTTITAGMFFMLQFDGILVITHHATDLIVPGAANITTAAGDILMGFAHAANQVTVLDYGSSATKAEMEAATDLAKTVTPGRMQNHPGVAKAWVQFDHGVIDGVADLTGVDVSHNITSVVDNGTGDHTDNFTTAFSSADYIASGMSMGTPIVLGIRPATSPTAGSIRIESRVSNTTSLADPSRVMIAFFGDQ